MIHPERVLKQETYVNKSILKCNNEPNYGVACHLDFYPLTPDRWNDIERLFGEKGACGGCWCMWWRLPFSDFQKQKGIKNKMAFKKIVEAGQIPGIIAYSDGVPVGWCSVSPRKVYSRLERSKILKSIDDKPVWSIVCFYIIKEFRRKGLGILLLEAALDHVKNCGGTTVEGYPIEPKTNRAPDAFVYTGVTSIFRRVGFREAIRRSKTRPIMRYSISDSNID